MQNKHRETEKKPQENLTQTKHQPTKKKPTQKPQTKKNNVASVLLAVMKSYHNN